MNERELRQLVADKKKAFDKGVTDGITSDELRALKDELKEAREKLDLVMEARGFDNPEIVDDEEIKPDKTKSDKRSVKELTDEEVEARYTKVFLKAIRGKKAINSHDEEIFDRVKSIRKFQSAVDEDGGLIIPVDVQTKINEFRRQFLALENLITVESVSTKSGSRVLV